jgi:glutamyl-tRNA synthetase
MTSESLRVRFAPSPTGYLHVGGARTALFNWLLARHAGGRFVLRIEDTDRDRSSDAMTKVILDGLQWLGLDWDEGPFHQADGLERHCADVDRLLQAGAAYRCFCSPEALERRRLESGSEPDAFRYDRHCLVNVPSVESARRAAAGEPFAVRFQVPPGETAWDDAVHGSLRFDNADIEDFIILRTDGTPVYNMAVVSDDVAMGITLVLRGDDHISNTPKQVLLYRALGHDVPIFAHVPMILGEDGKRLSKRHGATAVGEYAAQGILPWAMANFLALLGWWPGTAEEVFEVDELIQRFGIEGINRKSAIFDTTKLEWLNGQHLSRASAERLEPIVLPWLVDAGLLDRAAAARETEWLRRLIDLLKVRSRNRADFVRQARPYFTDDIVPEPDAVARHWQDPATAERLAVLRQRLAAVASWSPEPLEQALRSLAQELGIGAGKLIHPLRVALTGAAVSPGIFEVLAVMGRDRSLHRLDRAVTRLHRT